MPSLSHQILKHTVASTRHLTPELTLRLITEKCPLWTATGQLPFPDPYWGFYWPGGQATARYILDNAHLVSGLRTLDVGSGCGAVSIAAAKRGASRVVANDIDKYAVAASQLNAEMNHVKIETNSDDVIGTPCKEFDTILIGDMFYDEEFACKLFTWLHDLTENGKNVLIGDPGRHGLTDNRREYMTLLAKYKLPENSCIENNGFLETTVWRLNKK